MRDMILLTIPVVFAGAMAVLYWHLRKQPDRRRLWRATIRIGVGVGMARGAIASLGWYVVERTGGPLQIPAYALTMTAWPEAAILAERRVTPVPPEFYLSLLLVLVAGTMVFVGLVAMVVEVGRIRARQGGM